MSRDFNKNNFAPDFVSKIEDQSQAKSLYTSPGFNNIVKH